MKILMNEKFEVDDVVTRMLGGELPLKLKITAIDEQFIYCGAWKFNKKTLLEVDEDLGWDGITTTGSYLK